MQTSAITYIPANQLTFRQLARLINYAYEDYYLRVSLDSSQFEQMCFEEDMHLEHSIVAVHTNGDPVGLTMLSIREDAGWISGVGVVPERRRQGIAREMVKRVVDNALDIEISDLRLEVLVQNKRAMPLYEELSFAKLRDLLVLSQSHFAPLSERYDPDIYDIDVDTALGHYGIFHHISASWQRGLRSLQHRARRLSAIGFTSQSNLVGYVVYESRTDTFAIADLAVSPIVADRVLIGTKLLQAVQSRHPGAVGYTINIPAEDPLVDAFFDVGYHVWHQQHEMIYQP